MDALKVLIVGGTGSLGTELIKQLSKMPNTEITSLSRDEQKQQACKKIFPHVKYVLGDIKDKDSLNRHFKGKNVVFHVAALKHVDHIEENPIESVKTNILGTINVAECAIDNNIPRVVFSSTDKAVDSINVYGNCKSISEKILFDYNMTQGTTKFSMYRWGNICSSNGSAIPYFIDCLKKGLPVPVTDKKMTRFWINLEMAVAFVLETLNSPETLDTVLIPPVMKSAKVVDVIDCLAELLKIDKYTTKVIGVRRGEKLHECLTSVHSDKFISSENCLKYSRKDLLNLLKPYVKDTKWPRLSLVHSDRWDKDTKQSLSTLTSPSTP